MTLQNWLLIAFLSLCLGALVVCWMTVPYERMRFYRLMTLLFALAIACVILAWFTVPLSWLALLMSVIGVMVGYLLMTMAVLGLRERQNLPALTRAPGDPGDGHTAVVYFAHGEPETYTPLSWNVIFREFDQQKIAFIPFLLRPLFFARLRHSYEKTGSSPHNAIHQNLLAKVEAVFREKGDETTRFYLSFLDAAPHPAEAAIQAINEGASRLVLCEALLTQSNHTQEGEDQVFALPLSNYPVEVVTTRPLWDSKPLQQMFVEKLSAHLNTVPVEKIGVLLVGHGQPAAWDEAFPTETSQEIAFRLEIIEALNQLGIPKNNISMAWMEFRQPKPAEQVLKFIASGVEKIFYFSTAISAESLHSLVDVPDLMKRVKIPAHIELINMGAWNDHPLVVEAIVARIVAVK